ncbi:MAG: porin, partial [Deltaproteobacteria bacterium]|nr:porin [Deltaproteobacteria bacterium]
MQKTGLCTRINSGIAFATAAVMLSGTAASAQPVSVDQQVLQQLQETIKQQQQQLLHQADQIKKQSDLLQQLQQQVSSIQNKPAIQTPPAQPAVASGQPAPDPLQKTALPAPITSGNDKIKLSLSGQLSRAVNVINDGGRTKLYHVDNDVDNTKISLVGTANASSDLTVGTRLDVALTADESSEVSQTNQAPGNFIKAKWAEISLTSKKYGKISLGKGDTASNNTAIVDLSKTDIILYASISDIAGGIFFKEKNGATLSGTTIATAFNAVNGLGTESRLRYDSPSLYGFNLSGSLVSAQRSDIALNWGGEGYGFQAAGAFAVANPKIEGTKLLYDGSFSLL